MRDIFQDQPRIEALAWQFFKVILPVTRERLKDRYKGACDRMRPGMFKSNTRPEFMAMRDFYHDLLEANPPWAFKEEEEPARPFRSKGGGGKDSRNSVVKNWSRWPKRVPSGPNPSQTFTATMASLEVKKLPSEWDE